MLVVFHDTSTYPSVALVDCISDVSVAQGVYVSTIRHAITKIEKLSSNTNDIQRVFST